MTLKWLLAHVQLLSLRQGCIYWKKKKPGSGEYHPVSFRGNMKRGREKRGKCEGKGEKTEDKGKFKG